MLTYACATWQKSTGMTNTGCGGQESILPATEIINVLPNGTGTAMDRVDRFVPLQFPQKWRDENPNYLEQILNTELHFSMLISGFI